MIERSDAQRSAVVIGFVGPSGVGKSSLLEALMPRLVARGLAVGACKHAHHGFLADRPGKDSYRFYESGAAAVALISAEQIATFTRNCGHTGRDVSLAAAVATLPLGLDLILAEGFSWESIPRVVLFPSGGSPRQDHLETGEVVELVCVPSTPAGKRPAYSEALLDSLVETVLARIELPETSTMSGGTSSAARGDGNSS